MTGFPIATATPDCAPWDGPALSIVLSGESADPDSTQPPFLHVALWQSLDRVVGPIWRWPVDAQIGAASLCLAEQDCRAATRAIVWLEPFGVDSAVAGRLRLEFADRPTIAGSFRATWRPRIGRCG